MNIKEKPPQIIEKQLETIEQDVAPNHSRSRESILNMPEQELKEKFPKRYEIYVDLLRKSRQGELETHDLLEVNKWLGILNSLDEYIDQYEKEISEDPRHPIQQEVFRALRDFLEEGNMDGYVKLPTGSGKTVLFRRFLEAIKQRSLIVVPNNILVDQTVKHLSGSSVGEDVGVLNQHEKDYDAGSLVTTYASLIRNVNNGSLKPEDFSCLVLDEAHKALGKESTEVINKFKHAIRVGFTATPEYSETKTLKHLLDNEIYRMEVAEAIRAGMLSHARTWTVPTHVDLSSVGIRQGEYIEKDLAKKINDQGRNQLAVKYYKENFTGHQSVVYCAGVDHADTMAKLFQESGIPAEVISGKTNKKDKEAILERFRSGDTKILCNADILIEGFDDKNVSVCLNLRPTMSAVVAEQRGGRVLRLKEEDPNKIGYIVDFLDDDQLASDLSRPYPILYREVLGAVAVPRAIAYDSDPEAKGATGGIKKTDEVIPGLEVIGTEEQFVEILQKKAEYQAKQDERQKRIETRKRMRVWMNELSRRYTELKSDLKEINQNLIDFKETVKDKLTTIPNVLFSSSEFKGIEKILKEADWLIKESKELSSSINSTYDDDTYEFKKGWMRENVLSSPPFGNNMRRIEELKERFTEAQNRWANIFKSITDRKESPEMPQNVDEWKSANSIRKYLQKRGMSVSKAQIESAAEELKKNTQLKSMFMADENGFLHEHYQPELRDEIIWHLEKDFRSKK